MPTCWAAGPARIATRLLRERSARVAALEPGASMAAELYRAEPEVPLVRGEGNRLPFAADSFDVIAYAQAWHWTDPAFRWQRAAAAVSEGGALALFWNRDYVADPYVARLIGSALATYAPQIAVDESIDEASLTMSWPWGDLNSRAEFTDLNVLTYRRERSISSADYVSTLSTRSAFRILDPLVRERLFGEFRTQLPEQIDLHIATVLYLARRTASHFS